MIRILPHDKVDVLSKYKHCLEETDVIKYSGTVERVVGLTIESIGPEVSYGDMCRIRLSKGAYLNAQVVGFNKNRVILMPIGDMRGVISGAEVYKADDGMMVPVGDELLGRVIDGIGRPLDDKGEIYTTKRYPIDGEAVSPLERTLINKPLSVGIRSIDGLLTVGRGQRIGIFSGSGVGKSTLVCMIARDTDADVNIIALIGERGREVKDFVQKELGEDGLKKSVVIAATSDQPPMVRVRGAALAHTVAEYFRDKGLSVNLLMDSVTRYAMAQREIGLAAGEPSATRGYPPSVFSLLPKLMERSGTSSTGGSITGFYSVLVEGDDMNEPISDAARGILDGHIVLDRKLAKRGHYPAVDILSSVSRCMNDVISPEHRVYADRVIELLAAYADAEDMITLGAYARGSNPLVDKAIELKSAFDNFLRQRIDERSTFEMTMDLLRQLVGDEERKPRATASPAPAFASVIR